MKKDIKNNLFEDEAKEKIVNLFEKIENEFKHENIISCFEKTWVEKNLVTVAYKNNKNIPTNVTLTITDFEITIESGNEEGFQNWEIIIEACLK